MAQMFVALLVVGLTAFLLRVLARWLGSGGVGRRMIGTCFVVTVVGVSLLLLWGAYHTPNVNGYGHMAVAITLGYIVVQTIVGFNAGFRQRRNLVASGLATELPLPRVAIDAIAIVSLGILAALVYLGRHYR